MKKIFVLLSLIAISLNLSYSKEKKPNEEWKNKKFTTEELKKYNGQNGMPVYVAVDGIVYDVTKSKYWKTGKHKNLHDAGNDLTKEIKNDAPKFHKQGKILEKFPKVGVLEVEKSTTTATTEPKTDLKPENQKKNN